ncbi:MAG TPA: adenylate/guanylate cyclase domain-containing protein [Burkholderiales bacterium]|nr:adenylate/guanylate cyclase domain-containing protein [Burkholderiales bacterium]
MTTQEVKRKLTAILSADVKGYSRLMGEDEKWTVRTLNAYREVMANLSQQHRGRVVDATGDNLLAEFASVVDAVECSVEIQKELKTRNAELPENRRMEFRIGINLGDVIEEGGRIYGDGVNIAARIESLSEAGGVCISGSAYDFVGKKLPLGYEYLGEHTVKNIEKPVRVYKVLMEPQAAGKVIGEKKAKPRQWQKAALVVIAILVVVAAAFALWRLYLRPTPPIEVASKDKMAFPLPDKPSIAVLPFVNMGGDPEQAYFADGMTEDLITDLSKVAGLFVIARNSTFVYKGKATDVREVAKTLGVRYVLEGSVRRSGAQVRVNAQLIDATTGGHVWADRYDGELKNIFAFQDKVTRNVVAALSVELTKDDRERVARRGTENTQAYDVFLKGWQHYLRQTPEDFRAAIVQFKKAVELDPKYGRPYAALAATYWEAYTRYWDVALGFSRGRETHFQAEQFLTKAMRDPTPLAHQVASAMLLHTQQHDEAIAEAKRAIASDPNDADGYVALANALSFTGKPSEALELVGRAIRLNPHYPPYYLYQLGLAQFGMKRLDEAATSLERALALNRDDYWSQRLLLATYGLLGRRADAGKLLETIKRNEKRGQIASMDPLTIRAVTYWYPFSERADVERFAEGLRKAGVPE